MVQLFGRITKDAIVTEVKEGKKVVNFLHCPERFLQTEKW